MAYLRENGGNQKGKWLTYVKKGCKIENVSTYINEKGFC